MPDKAKDDLKNSFAIDPESKPLGPGFMAFHFLNRRYLRYLLGKEKKFFFRDLKKGFFPRGPGLLNRLVWVPF
jgi:hypothetical protein